MAELKLSYNAVSGVLSLTYIPDNHGAIFSQQYLNPNPSIVIDTIIQDLLKQDIQTDRQAIADAVARTVGAPNRRSDLRVAQVLFSDFGPSVKVSDKGIVMTFKKSNLELIFTDDEILTSVET